MLGVEVVAEQVLAATLAGRGELDPQHDLDVETVSGLYCLGPARGRVVIGQRDHVETRIGRKVDEFPGRVRAVAPDGMLVQIDPRCAAVHPPTAVPPTRSARSGTTDRKSATKTPVMSSRRLVSYGNPGIDISCITMSP